MLSSIRNSKGHFYVKDIEPAIRNNESDRVMALCDADETFTKKAVLYCIELDKPEILKRVISRYPHYNNFQFRQGQTAASFEDIHEGVFSLPKYNCALSYAISQKRWDCAILIATAHYCEITYTPDFKGMIQIAHQNKQYQVIEAILGSKYIELNSRFGGLIFPIMEYAVHSQDPELIRIGLKYNVKYGEAEAKNALFISEKNAHIERADLASWFVKICTILSNDNSISQTLPKDVIFKIFLALIPGNYKNEVTNGHCEKATQNTICFFNQNRIKTKIERSWQFVRDYNLTADSLYWTIVISFNSEALAMDNLVKKINQILKRSNSNSEKVHEIDDEISKFLLESASRAKKQGSLVDFNKAVKVLTGKPWLISRIRYDLLNDIHKKYVADLRSELSTTQSHQQTVDYCYENKTTTGHGYEKELIEKVNPCNANQVGNTNCSESTSTYATVFRSSLSSTVNVNQTTANPEYLNTNNNQVYTFPGMLDDDVKYITEQSGYINTNDLENLPSVPRHTINIYPQFSYAKENQPEKEQVNGKQLSYGF